MGKKDEGGSAAENIKVLVRCRPLNEKEKLQGFKSGVELDLASQTVSVKSVVGDGDRWTFDGVINNTFTQSDIFTQFMLPLVNSVVDGFNATVFAYGQSGSGKTHTMTGRLDVPGEEGVIPRCFAHVFTRIQELKESSPLKVFQLCVSFVELYNGNVRDLLAQQQVTLAVRENKDKTFYVQGANMVPIKYSADALRLMEEGLERRRVGSTELNQDSSRSHSIFSLYVQCTETTEDGDSTSVTSKLNLVDLAGSERQGKTGASGDTLREGCNINLSLSALGTVIDTLVRGKGGHIPFRSSPLTMLLKDSLGGSSKTVMFANINPSESNVSETVSTLRFADRAKQIKNKPIVNMDIKDQKIKELSEQVMDLKEKLKMYETEGTGGLETKLETLREQLDNLQVDLENANSGRGADRVDFDNAIANLNEEKKSLCARVSELEETVEQLTARLAIAEATGRDEQKQREEVMLLCATYLHARKGTADAPEPFTSVDELAEALRDVTLGGESAETARLHSQIQSLELEKRQLVREKEGAVMELEIALKDVKNRAKQVESKMKKVEEAARRSSVMSPMSSAALLLENGNDVGVGDVADGLASSSREATVNAASTATSPAAPVGSPGARAKGSSSTKRLEKELTSLRADLEEERGGRAEIERSRNEALQLVRDLQAELSASERKVVEAVNATNELRTEYERKIASASSAAGEVQQMETSLKKRTAQLHELRDVVEKQKALIAENTATIQEHKSQMKKLDMAVAEKDETYKRLLREKDEAFQRMLNQRLELYITQHAHDLAEREHTTKKIKKKLRKTMGEVGEWKQKYDELVCEVADLQRALEEQKVEQMKLIRRHGKTEEEAEVCELKEQIHNAIGWAKEEQRRKKNLFTLGEVPSARNNALASAAPVGSKPVPRITPPIHSPCNKGRSSMGLTDSSS